MERRRLLIDTRIGDKSKDIWLDWRQLIILTLMISVTIVSAKGEDAGESGESLSRLKREDCDCVGSETPLKCRCHSGEDAYDQICRIQSSGFNMPQTQSVASPCKPVCERSCIQSCTAQLQPVSQCAATCTFTCDKTCGQFQVSIQQLQAAANKNQAIPHVLILGGTQSPPTCKCPQNEPNCPCNCLPRCQNNCQQNCQANGQSPSQCANTCTQSCSSTCLANSIVQDSGIAPASTGVIKNCVQQCPNACQKVCIRLQPTLPLCQQNCVNTCNQNCMNIQTTTTEAPTPPPYIPAQEQPQQPPSRDCVPVCQPACLKSCTSVYQQQEQQQQPSQQVPTTYGSENSLQFGYLYGLQNVQQPGILPSVNQAQPGVYQPPQQIPQYVQPQQPQQQLQAQPQQQYNYASQQQQVYSQPQPQQPQQYQQPTDSKKLVTVTICIPQCMPQCLDSCIQNVATALQQHHQQQQQALQTHKTTVTCPAQCEPDCRPTCIQSVIQQTQAQQSVPLPSGSVTCPSVCMPECQPQCLINQAPNYLTSNLQQQQQPLNPRGIMLPSPQSNYGHLQQSSNQQQSKFSMLNKPSTTTQKPNDNNGPKTCISSCMPLCLDECVNAGMEDEVKSNEIKSQPAAPTITYTNNFQNNNKPSVFTNFKNQTHTNIPNQNGQIFLNLNHNNSSQNQNFVPRQNNTEPMRVMIHYTSEPKYTTTVPYSTTSSKPHTTTTTPLMFIPKILPASMANQQQQNPSIDPFDPSKLSQQKPNPNFHIGTSTSIPLHSTPATKTTTTNNPSTTPSSKSRSLTELIRQKCESSCEKVCNAECKKVKNPPDEICVLTCKHDCVASCSRKFQSKILKTKAA
uniref:Uncharacterized protein n=1 Tax=Panagrolaimus superbus TaxID=310955 RepID=A0A914Z3G6_9BILA